MGFSEKSFFISPRKGLDNETIVVGTERVDLVMKNPAVFLVPVQ